MPAPTNIVDAPLVVAGVAGVAGVVAVAVPVVGEVAVAVPVVGEAAVVAAGAGAVVVCPKTVATRRVATTKRSILVVGVWSTKLN